MTTRTSTSDMVPLLDPAHGEEPLSNLVYEVPSNIDGVGGTPCICFSVLDEGHSGGH